MDNCIPEVVQQQHPTTITITAKQKRQLQINNCVSQYPPLYIHIRHTSLLVFFFHHLAYKIGKRIQYRWRRTILCETIKTTTTTTTTTIVLPMPTNNTNELQNLTYANEFNSQYKNQLFRPPANDNFNISFPNFFQFFSQYFFLVFFFFFLVA